VDAFKQLYVDFHDLFYVWYLLFMQPIKICYNTHFDETQVRRTEIMPGTLTFCIHLI
jgi:hypothetical protein